jgi:hypothetical protein
MMALMQTTLTSSRVAFLQEKNIEIKQKMSQLTLAKFGFNSFHTLTFWLKIVGQGWIFDPRRSLSHRFLSLKD